MSLLDQIAERTNSRLERRLLLEYGSVFVTQATPPPSIVFADSDDVERFQAGLSTQAEQMGDHLIELQAPAMGALISAAGTLAARGRSLTARAADAGRRSYDDTVRLWQRNVTRGLERWQAEGLLDAVRAERFASMPLLDQVSAILEIEDREQIWFGTFFDKSILYSVAAPGASQHLSMLAFDVAEFEEPETSAVLAEHGWHRTVPFDFPHFTYLGHRVERLRRLGLKPVVREYKGGGYEFWIPDIE